MMQTSMSANDPKRTMMLNLSEMRRRLSVRRAGTPVLERQMKRSLAWSSLIGAVVYAVSTWLSADGVLVLGTALAAERASLSGDELRKTVSGKTVYLKISGFELPIRYSPGGSMSGRMGAVAATLHAATAHPTAANGGSRAVNSASNGRAGWRGSPIATRSPVGAIA